MLSPTCKETTFDVQLVGHADFGAELQHHQHGEDHDDALPEEWGLEMPPKPGETPHVTRRPTPVLRQPTQSNLGPLTAMVAHDCHGGTELGTEGSSESCAWLPRDH